MAAEWKRVIPCSCTFAALGAGVGSLLASGSGNFLLAAQLILVSLILDGLDGTLARLLRAQSSFGAELDTYVDFTSFGLAPAVLLYFHEPGGLQNLPGWGLALAMFYVMSGAARLSRFRAVDPYRGQRGYLGLPITLAAAWVAAYLIALESVALTPLSFSLTGGPLAAGFWGVLLAMLGLQVSRIRYPKPTQNPKVLIPSVVLVVLLFIPSVALVPLGAIFAYGLWFAFISPFYFRRFLSHLPPVEESQPVAVVGGPPKEKP